MGIIELLVFLCLLGLAFWVVNVFSRAFGIPGPIVTVIQVILVVFAVLVLLQASGLWAGGPVLRLR
jgi:uncharacterized membrane protein (DUF2068 family)